MGIVQSNKFDSCRYTYKQQIDYHIPHPRILNYQPTNNLYLDIAPIFHLSLHSRLHIINVANVFLLAQPK